MFDELKTDWDAGARIRVLEAWAVREACADWTGASQACIVTQGFNVRCSHILVRTALTKSSPAIFDEYTRRQYVAKAPERNPFGEEEEPNHDDVGLYIHEDDNHADDENIKIGISDDGDDTTC